MYVTQLICEWNYPQLVVTDNIHILSDDDDNWFTFGK
jgi:hypothetical protein